MTKVDTHSGRASTRGEGPRVGPHSAPPPPASPHVDGARAPGTTGNGAGFTAPTAAESRSLTDLLKELRDEGLQLMRNEVALAKAEMTEKARIYSRNGAKALSGSIVLLLGATYLVGGIITAVYFILWELGMSNLWAGFVSVFGVSIIVAIIGWAMINSAKTKIQQESPYPEKTAESMEENKQWLEQKIR